MIIPTALAIFGLNRFVVPTMHNDRVCKRKIMPKLCYSTSSVFLLLVMVSSHLGLNSQHPCNVLLPFRIAVPSHCEVSPAVGKHPVGPLFPISLSFILLPLRRHEFVCTSY